MSSSTMTLLELSRDWKSWRRKPKAAPLLRAHAREPGTSRAMRSEIAKVIRLVESAEWLAMLIEDGHEKGEQVSGAEWHLASMAERLRPSSLKSKPRKRSRSGSDRP